ncbi:unnamed protein product [Anisakis simplex]|uniref:Transposase n=1 Tax=Anisakis simplex TaxID=6269 RepID=A0A0M3J8J8_ANISI|nr:unnamed protein product [Anisakis simplex]
MLSQIIGQSSACFISPRPNNADILKLLIARRFQFLHPTIRKDLAVQPVHIRDKGKAMARRTVLMQDEKCGSALTLTISSEAP